MPQVPITFRTSQERKEYLERVAVREELAVTDIVNRAIREYQERNPEKEQEGEQQE